MVDLPRVFFDGNSRFPGPTTRFDLGFDQSKKDLAAIPGGPRIGLSVVMYESELEMEALLEFDPVQGEWAGIPVPGTTKYLDPVGD